MELNKKDYEENHNILLPHLCNIEVIFPSFIYYNVHSFKFVFIACLASDIRDASNGNDSSDNDDDGCACLHSRDTSREEAMMSQSSGPSAMGVSAGEEAKSLCDGNSLHRV